MTQSQTDLTPLNTLKRDSELISQSNEKEEENLTYKKPRIKNASNSSLVENEKALLNENFANRGPRFDDFLKDLTLPPTEIDNSFLSFRLSDLSHNSLNTISNACSIGTEKTTIQFLTLKLAKLEKDNQRLGNHLLTLVEEIEAKQNCSENEQEKNSTTTSWHSFQPTNIAVSVWRKALDGNKILIECNQYFVELVGYSLEVLQSSFSSQKLVTPYCLSKDTTPKETGEKRPKRIWIQTAKDLKEVYCSITSTFNSEFIIYMQPIHNQK